MTGFTESSSFDTSVTRYETTTAVQGGPGGASNGPLQSLVNRTRWLFDQVSAITTSLAGYAPLNSPALSGSPTVPTLPLGDATAKIANAAFVQGTVNGIATVPVGGSANVTLTQPQWGAAILILTGALTGNINLIFPTQAGRWLVLNQATGAFSLTLKTAGGSGVVIDNGTTLPVFCDGTGILPQQTDFRDTALRGSPTAPTASALSANAGVATNAYADAAVAAGIATRAPLAGVSGSWSVGATLTVATSASCGGAFTVGADLSAAGNLSASGGFAVAGASAFGVTASTTISSTGNYASSALMSLGPFVYSSPAVSKLSVENAYGTAAQFFGTSTSSPLPVITVDTRLPANYLAVFSYGGTVVGRISTDSANCYFTNVSDYRVKTNIAPMRGALDRILGLRPVIYDYKAGIPGEGFIAHELQEQVPLAVIGEKDGEEMQSVDLSKLMPVIVAAFQDLHALVVAQGEEIAALKAHAA